MYAFPRPVSIDPSQGTLHDGDEVIEAQHGITIRDYFAAAASQGVPCGILAEQMSGNSATRLAAAAYEIADAMMIVRSSTS